MDRINLAPYSFAQIVRICAFARQPGADRPTIGFDANRAFSDGGAHDMGRGVKDNAIAFAHAQFTDAELAAAIAASQVKPARDPSTVRPYGRKSGRGVAQSAVTPASAPQTPAVVPAAALAPTATGNALIDALHGMIAAVAGSAVNTDQVNALIDARLSGFVPSATPAPIAVTVTRPDMSTVKIDRAHKLLPDVIAAAAARVNCMLVGPAGSGKTTLAEQVADALGLPFYSVSSVQSEFALSGYMDAAGKYHTTPFREAFERGGVCLWDEMDNSDASALVWANMATANNSCPFPDAPQGIKKHADFILIGGANTYGTGASREYVGRNQLDAATLDRFGVLTMDYDEALELAIAGDNEWTRHVQAVRAAITKLSATGERIRHVVSPRASIAGNKLLAAGLSRAKVESMVLYKGLAADVVTRIKGVL